MANREVIIIVPAADVLEARDIAASRPGGTGMFMTARTTVVNGTVATHYLSSGLTDEEIPATFEGFNLTYGTEKYVVRDINGDTGVTPQMVLDEKGLYPLYEVA